MDRVAAWLKEPGSRPLEVDGLVGAGAEFLAAAAWVPRDGALLWVCATDKVAERVAARLRGFCAGPVLRLPDWDVKPYGGYSPSAEVSRARLAALFELRAGGGRVVVASARALLKRVVQPAELDASAGLLRVGEEIDRDALVGRLVEGGYLSTDQCGEPGSYSVRGHVLDVYSPGMSGPVRVELWGDEIESMRTYDPYSQRSLEDVTEARLLPVREARIRPCDLDALPQRLKALADARGVKPRVRVALQDELREQRVLQELELLLPLLRPELATVADYLPPGSRVVWQDPEAIESRLLGWHDELATRWRHEGGSGRLVPEPGELFVEPEELRGLLARHPQVVLGRLLSQGGPTERLRCEDHQQLRPEMSGARAGGGSMLDPLLRRLERWIGAGLRVAFVSRSRRRFDELSALLEGAGVALAEYEEPPTAAILGGLANAGPAERRRVALLRGEVDRGFVLPDEHLVVLSEEDIFGPRRRGAGAVPRRRKGIASFGQLARGEHIVHADHGIGRYEGLVKLDLAPTAADVRADQRERAADPTYKPGTRGKAGAGRGSNADFLLLIYKGGDRLFLPVHKLSLLSRYSSTGGVKPPLDKLGGTAWKKRRQKVSEDVQKVARELLDLYARRHVARSRPYPPQDELYNEFTAAFPFEETPDQQAAIDAVMKDLADPRPMDRLVCGDVGFGKTEVALRAIFRAVEAGRQVAVLVPTTILALQHLEKFVERLVPFGIEVEMLSRFRSAAQQRRTLRRLAEGRCDVVVGTHRLLGKDLDFKDLGLIVVDEEHRFGVKHKERLKKLRASVDVLTLTATPIPRTLHMALSGIRDLSLIETPPLGRRPVKTSVARFSPRRIQDAVRAELERGGQVFFVHNRVKSIYRVADLLGKLLPEVRVRVAHGQMDERVLEDIMVDFFHRQFDVLLCTTIIESGIDVPTANTMIIHRADQLGLAQLHQLRGRVGRSTDQGHCLLMVPPGRSLSSTALKRLRAISDHSELGSGRRLAQEDLEIRGAGSLLGSKQSGQIASVGFSTYMDLLETAVRRLRGEEVDEGPEPDIELRSDAWIPGDYVPDERDRLLHYKQLADARTRAEVAQLIEDLEDRYGHAPDEVRRFEQLIAVKVRCRELQITSLKVLRGGRLQLVFDPQRPPDPDALLALVAGDPRRYTLRPEGQLVVALTATERQGQVPAARALLEHLNPPPPSG